MMGLERHPLARGGWCTRFVPVGFLMIYAPRTKEEVNVVMDIILAGIGWVSGEQLNELDTVRHLDCIESCHPGTVTSANRNETGVVKDVANAVMEVA